MQVPFFFLMIDERPQQLMYLCPVCGHQNFTPATAELGALPCRQCGMQLDARLGDLEVLTRGGSEKEQVHPAIVIQ